MTNIPEWALKHKQKNMQITRNKDNYYLYKIGGKWDPVKKRMKKITEEYLGKITPDGVIPPKHKRNKITSLDKNNKTLQKLQILLELKNGEKKSNLSKKYNITTKTINNIKKRFQEKGVEGLLHKRKPKNKLLSLKKPIETSNQKKT